jgi:hypothetical protein
MSSFAEQVRLDSEMAKGQREEAQDYHRRAGQKLAAQKGVELRAAGAPANGGALTREQRIQAVRDRG